jgi:hypothetical protein
MKTFLAGVGLCLTLLALSCQKPAVEPTESEAPDSVTDVGEPLGVPLGKTIGPEGGTLATPDGRVSLRVPAGAVTTPTAFSIQPIENHAPNGLGTAYRFEPDGAQFKQPLALTFSYAAEVPTGGQGEDLRVGYQKPDGAWYGVPGVQVDAARRQVTVPMTHFSDWALLETFSLGGSGDPDDLLPFGKSTTLYVNEVVALDNGQEEALRLRTFGKERIGNWSLVGGGMLQPGGDGRATYTAPRGPGGPNPVTVSVELTFPNRPTKLILVTQIAIGQGYVKVNFGGKTYFFDAGVYLGDDDPDDPMLIAGGNAQVALSLELTAAGPGTFPFGTIDYQPNASRLDWEFNGGKQYDTDAANCNGEDRVSEGSVTLSRYRQGRYAKGTFRGTVIDLDNDDPCDTSGPAISGEFHVRPLPEG